MRRVLDIAGIAVELRAADADRERVLRDAVAGFEVTRAAPRAAMVLGAEPQAIPRRPPDDEQHGRRLWLWSDGALVLAADDVGVRIEGARAEGWLRARHDAPSFEPLATMGLSWLLAREGRFVLHAAAVGRGGDAVIALGHSGAGKSSLGLAALDAGMELLTDDAAIIEPHACGLRVHGVHQAPNPPRELGGALLDGADPRRDHRDRARLDAGVLTTGPRRIVGVVIVGHARGAGGELERLPGHAAMPLLLQSFVPLADPAHRAAYLPVAGRLARLPVWRLGHGTDASARRVSSARHLERCLLESRTLSGGGS